MAHKSVAAIGRSQLVGNFIFIFIVFGGHWFWWSVVQLASWPSSLYGYYVSSIVTRETINRAVIVPLFVHFSVLPNHLLLCALFVRSVKQLFKRPIHTVTVVTAGAPTAIIFSRFVLFPILRIMDFPTNNGRSGSAFSFIRPAQLCATMLAVVIAAYPLPCSCCFRQFIF